LDQLLIGNAMTFPPLRLFLALALPSATLASAAHADPIAVPNFSFEADKTGGDNAGSALIEGWKATGDPKYAFAMTMDPGLGFEGAEGPSTPKGALGPQCALLWTRCTLTSAAPLTLMKAGATYTLKVAVGDSSLDDQEPGNLQIGFLIGDACAANSSETFDANDSTPEGTFNDHTFTYTATQADAGKPLKIFVTVTDDASSVALDNFRLEESA
jgi:hypothetical protein